MWDLSSCIPTNVSPAEHKGIKLLKEDEVVVIVLANKKTVRVVMNSEGYSGKIRSLLADIDTYKRLANDPTSVHERMNTQLLLLMRYEAIPEHSY